MPGAPFTNVQSDYYWSGTSYSVPNRLWRAYERWRQRGGLCSLRRRIYYVVWPVRGVGIDTDNDGMPDGPDNCLTDSNPDQTDTVTME